jgi:hypothetical protein
MPKPKAGELSRMRQQLETWALISLVSGHRTMEEDSLAEQIQDRDTEALLALIQAVDLWIGETLYRFVQWCCSRLIDQQGWVNLAHDPKQFNPRLDLYLIGIKTAMRLLYDVPDHRPITPNDVAKRVALLRKDHPSASWGQLSIKYRQKFNEQITPKAAERAYKRFVGRTHRFITDVLRIEEEYRKQSGLPEAELSEKLPTPEDLFDILTHD